MWLIKKYMQKINNFIMKWTIIDKNLQQSHNLYLLKIIYI
jgi:hypothetical protein